MKQYTEEAKNTAKIDSSRAAANSKTGFKRTMSSGTQGLGKSFQKMQ